MTDLRAEVDQQLEALQREMSEIDLLLQQTRVEADRHGERLKEARDRLPVADPDAAAASDQLLAVAQRATLMDGQVQVLEGKQKTLRRFADFLTELAAQLTGGEMPLTSGNGQSPSRALLAAQEEMRRDISRQMHDGPAQAIANIALQAQLVRRLAAQSPTESHTELDRLGEMVQRALDSTKAFIFEVRPMVLDDLGLVATLRRAAPERSQRSGVPVRFDSVGEDRRLPPELESNLFRLIDDAVAAFVSGRPAEVSVRLDWTAGSIVAHVDSRPQVVAEDPAQAVTPTSPDAPPGLISVLEERREYEATKAARAVRASALPDEVWADLSARADALGFRAELGDDGHALVMTASTAA